MLFMKAERNRTIELSENEKNKYFERCIRLDSAVKKRDITDRTVIGDTFDVMKNLPECFADLVIADPPYNLDKNFNGNKFSRISDDEYAEYTVRWVEAVKPLMKKDASLYVCCDYMSGMVIADILKKYFIIQNRITWQREKGRGAEHNWKNGMEDIWFCTMGSDYKFNVDAVKMRRKVMAPYRVSGRPKDWEETEQGNFRNTYPSNFWDDISVPYWSMPENTSHPTQKPEKLLAKLILASTDEKDIVFDPFLGSGSVSVTAKKLGRHYIGIEQNEEYCALAEKRLEMAETDRTIQGYSDGVFWERNTAVLQKKAGGKK